MLGIMFVCTGNICRSAMAHHYLQKRLYDLKKENEIYVSSCGISAYTGEGANINSIIAMKKYDVDLTAHKATNIDDIDIVNYDLILCMSKAHVHNVLLNYPKLKGKVYTLKEYVLGDLTEKSIIEDPWGYDINVYNNCAYEIVECVDKLLEKI